MTRLNRPYLTTTLVLGTMAACLLLLQIMAPHDCLELEPTPAVCVVPLGADFANPVNITNTASITQPALTFEGDTDTGIYHPAADTIAITISGTEKIRLDTTAITIGGHAYAASSPITISGVLTDIIILIEQQ